MAWSGDGSDYDEGEDGEETGTDIEDLPDEELIVVLRDEQNSIKEAQRLIHKEIKSIRRELKRLLRQYAATHTDQQGSDELPHQRRSIDSGLSDVNYTTDYTTASELASSHGDSEAGYQAFLEYDTDGSTGHLKGDGRYRQQSLEVYESGSGYEDDAPMGYPPPNYMVPEGAGASLEQQSGTENGFRPGCGMPPHWNSSEMNQAMDDHTRGRNSTYEDAYSMVRRRHSGDTPTRNSKSKSSGNRWKSIIHKHGKSIYSIPESDQSHLVMREDSRLHSKGNESMQSSEDEMRNFQDFSDSSVNNGAEQPRRYGSQSINSGHITRKFKRSQSAQQIDVRKLTISGSSTPEPNRETSSPRPNMPVLRKTQSSQFLLRPNSMNGVPSDRPPSVASDTSEKNGPIRGQWNGNSRTPAMSSEDEARDSPRFSDSSYDSYIDTKYSSRPSRSSPGLSMQKDHSKHHQQQGRMNSPRLKKTPSSPNFFSNTGSRNPNSHARQSYSVSDKRHRNAVKDENWNEGLLLESQSDFLYHSSEEAYRESYADYKGQKYPHRNNQPKRRDKFLRDMGKSSTHPLMKV
ncbi:uncharacterized protein LOC119740508 [Patiria miniata]|uniref:Uncharacterized protein n=1 Tax=Patiria miniata TaxID=46514 RepID=A0A914B6L9_PATMI|nr:uncharacterized protein LOC119740508 [Patiria miniata]XP_038071764.1 uncharacterized protein LOC119740508 [Patiria miniata]XP_038071766.1 uncharacterized protein LOC119740508 [Patiria miniata]XP_038071767.1 uncharacterized protein LOC119740508 [Patiria miniata]XP_038071768.1 uncharacterized protein LOC119740508 [Patiria miniata]XP_038071769.1 uncharacterized protein LOC119740508 [Patiria miniata]XP_038071770.1 uncharacterized protein LOC119740508 [Patiria miniata]